MEIEMEGGVKELECKVKGMSRELPTQKASHIIDSDLRSHWSTSTNTKEWILLQLNEPCLLTHVRIYNKSVLEWEISVGLRYKPETFVKVRSRCEAPRRDIVYPVDYTPCRYVRISCLRGNPIAIFFIQLFGVSVSGLEPEFQPVVNYLLPNIIIHKQDVHDTHLQLLKDMAGRLPFFLPQLEADLTSFSDAEETNLRFLAMLAGPFYPILHIAKERESARCLGSITESEGSRSNQPSSLLTVSSNFEPRRSRISNAFSTSSFLVFRPDAIFLLLRKAYKDSNLGAVCRIASRILQQLLDPAIVKSSLPSHEVTFSDETSTSDLTNPVFLVDYTNLFGDEFKLPDIPLNSSYLNILDIGAVDEGILHVLYCCTSQPLLCSKLAGSTSAFWSALPLIQALLPALRPCVNSSSDHVNDIFSHWKQPFVRQAFSLIVSTTSSALFHPLLRACSGYLSSFSPSHVKAACVLIDLCSGVLAPWMDQVVVKVDLTLELLEDLLGTIQGSHNSVNHARAALMYIVLALSGHMDDILAKYKEVKHQILFLLEMLERFLDPVINARSSTTFKDMFLIENHEHSCGIALNIIRTAVHKPSVLPSLESEWRRGTVAPSVLLSILEPRMQLPQEVDLCKSSVFKYLEKESSTLSSVRHVNHCVGALSKSNFPDDLEGNIDIGVIQKMDIIEDMSLFFALPELRTNTLISSDSKSSNVCHVNDRMDKKYRDEKKLVNQFQNGPLLDADFFFQCSNMHVDYMQLMNYEDCELKASEFRRLAFDLHSQDEITPEGHEASIDALLMAAECYVNPFFISQMKVSGKNIFQKYEFSDLKKIFEGSNSNLERVSFLEIERDKLVLQILLEAAELDNAYKKKLSDRDNDSYYSEGNNGHFLNLFPLDSKSADAITIVRQNQTLLCNFIIQQLQRKQHSMHEILIQSLLFILRSATKLFCDPEQVILAILGSSKYLNGLLFSFYNQFNEKNLKLDLEKVHKLERHWTLLQKLIIASSGSNKGPGFDLSGVNSGFHYGNLIPPSAWIEKIPIFSSSDFPLVRFLGWMAVSRNAEQYVKERFFFIPTLSQLTNLLSIFSDDLALVDNVIKQKDEDVNIDQLRGMENLLHSKGIELSCQKYRDQSFRTLYPELSKLFPNMRKQFEAFREIILDAVGIHLRYLSSSALPDILCWFSDLCSCPFLKNDKVYTQNGLDYYKGYVGKNARAVILFILEAIVIEHMEAMVPEIPRLVQVLVSFCGTSYCNVPFLDSILHLLRPIISYSLNKVSDEEKVSNDDSCLNFESLCFDELFRNIRHKDENQNDPAGKVENRALTIYILAYVFLDLSFQRKMDFLSSHIIWADFTNFVPTSSFHDYLSVFQTVMQNCEALLVYTLRVFDVIPLPASYFTDVNDDAFKDSISESHSWFLNDVCCSVSPFKVSSEKVIIEENDVILNQKLCYLSIDEVGYFTEELERVISSLIPTIELCWKDHHQLAKKLTIVMARCIMYSRYSFSLPKKTLQDQSLNRYPSNLVDHFKNHWGISLEKLAKTILSLQESYCWEVSSIFLDCILGLPKYFCLNNVFGAICSAIKNFICSAPKITWRLQSDKWLSVFFAKGLHNLHASQAPLIDLFCTMLGHPEPEQRFIALQHLWTLVGGIEIAVETLLSSAFLNKLVSPSISVFVSEPLLPLFVSSTWDLVALVASSDTSLLLRTRAMSLLVDYIPFANQCQLESFLVGADTILYGFGKLTHPTCEVPLTKLSLALIASACLHSPTEAFSLIPENVWTNMETMGMSKSEGSLGDIEKKACQALCKLRTEGDGAKEVLKEILCSSDSKENDPDFANTRVTILQIIGNLTSVQSYLDFFANKVNEEAMALEEAQIEMDIIQKENAPEKSSRDSKAWQCGSFLRSDAKDDNRLQTIKDDICSIEKSKLREDIVARRQKKLLMRRSRQQNLEVAALREAELLQELDSKRTAALESEIERQCLLELERAKTRELRHSLDMEKERQTQRDIQRELEQAESGMRTSRREFSTQSSRPRDRFRERETGRSNNDGSIRTGGNSGLQQNESAATCTTMTLTNNPSFPNMPQTVVLSSGSRVLSLGQSPTILQSRDHHPDEHNSGYDENLEGSKDLGDMSSVGDPELQSAFDPQRQQGGSRGGGRSRQVMDRRERDTRREGKWERKPLV